MFDVDWLTNYLKNNAHPRYNATPIPILTTLPPQVCITFQIIQWPVVIYSFHNSVAHRQLFFASYTLQSVL